MEIFMKTIGSIFLLSSLVIVSANAKIVCSATCVKDNRSFKSMIAIADNVIEAQEKFKVKCDGEVTVTTYVKGEVIITDPAADWDQQCEEL